MILTRPNSAIADMVESRYRKRRSFAAGFTLTDAREVLLLETDGNYYQWKGSLPKIVPVASTPQSTGGISASTWVSVGKADDLANMENQIDILEDEVDQLKAEIPESGKSAYQVAVANGFVGTEQQWLASLKGDPGAPLNLLGTVASVNLLPTTGNVAGNAWIVGEDMYAWDGTAWKKVTSQGPEGKSAYQVWLAAGNTGSVLDYLNSIKGQKGDPGPQGKTGATGQNANGFQYQGIISNPSNLPTATPTNVSYAYSYGSDLYVSDGTKWVNMGPIVGPAGPTGPTGKAGADGEDGDDGLSAYQIWLNQGNIGSEADFIASLKGKQGEPGPTGEPGQQGLQGIQGPVGQGLNIVDVVDSEADLPAKSNPGEGYLVGPNEYLYVWIPDPGDVDTGTYKNVGKISGISITSKGQVANQAALPATAPYGTAYTTADTGTLFIYTLDMDTNTGSWINMGVLKGPAGTPGSTWLSGTTVPAAGTGVNGDFYLNTATSDVYKKTSGAWAVVVNIKGPTGATGTAGTNGATWLSGSGVPAAATGANGDFYLNTATSDVYKKTSGAWAIVVNIKGPTGATGAAGTNGTNGSVWLTGAGVPASNLGANGDLYLNTTTSDVYQKTSGTWAVITNIKGATGDAANAIGTPFPDVWMPLNDDLRLLAGIAPYDTISISGQTLELPSKSATFTRSTTATYIDKSGVMRTADINEPRFEREGLLIEPQISNLYINSETIIGGSLVITTPNASTSPTGVVSMTKFTESTSSAEHYCNDKGISLTAGTIYCYSAYVKDDTANRLVYLRIASGTTAGMFFDIKNETAILGPGSAANMKCGFEKMAGGIYRIWVSFTATASQSTIFRLQMVQNAGVASYTGDGASGFYIWGIQVEESPFPTSYIPTGSAAVTRSADNWQISKENCGYTTLADLFNRTVALEFHPKYLQDAAGYIEIVKVQGPSNDIVCRWVNDNTLKAYRGSGAISVPCVQGVSGVYVHTTEGNNITNYYNGNSNATTVAPNGTTQQVSYIGNINQSLSVKFVYHIRNLRVWHRLLSDAQIKGLR